MLCFTNILHDPVAIRFPAQADVRHLVNKHLKVWHAHWGVGSGEWRGMHSADPINCPPAPCVWRQEGSRHESMRKDQASHFILRLAYCRTGDLRAWLLTHELALFRVRFKELDVEQQV